LQIAASIKNLYQKEHRATLLVTPAGE